MADVMKKATRDSYGEALVELGQQNPNIVVFDADLAGATKTGVFKKAFPDRFFDCGIAECNMMGIAAGLATTGKVPFASTFAMFAAGRGVNTGETAATIAVGTEGIFHGMKSYFCQNRQTSFRLHTHSQKVITSSREFPSSCVLTIEL